LSIASLVRLTRYRLGGRNVWTGERRRPFCAVLRALKKFDEFGRPNSVDTVATVERQEVERVGHQMARERGLTYMPANAGDYVSDRLAGMANLDSGRFAMIDNGLGFQLVPRQPILEKNPQLRALRQ
jgi:hypothetical protein